MRQNGPTQISSKNHELWKTFLALIIKISLCSETLRPETRGKYSQNLRFVLICGSEMFLSKNSWTLLVLWSTMNDESVGVIYLRRHLLVNQGKNDEISEANYTIKHLNQILSPKIASLNFRIVRRRSIQKNCSDGL